MSEVKYCPHCGSVGAPKTRVKGSFATELVLWLLLLVPGLIYSVWRGTTRYEACAECGAAGLIPRDSPRALEALGPEPETATPGVISALARGAARVIGPTVNRRR